ncbi:hypothetical protein JRO89_XS11G0042100 [Xanthoceras sorbifolium]|uniref:PC-Esterase n=1 Tax=Xanthoceras sorbifolium TaxID=99658 RepID=A0ABQ8HEN2_9ROSI|nr:hypothetical protein JRO89_XS11G0042100 [Xanthoceras sorbifolium]
MIEGVQRANTPACLVFIVYTLMAAWHLSRNKLLFFSCALFITLAVGVHLTPSFTSFFVFDHYRDSCTDLVNEIVWDVQPKSVDVLDVQKNSTETYDKNWDWVRSGKVSACEFQKFSKSDALHLLNRSWVVVAGDSQARLFVVSLLRLVLDEERMDSIEGDWLKRHSDYKLVIDEIGMKLDFIWAPYETNLTHLIMKYKVKRTYPDVLVMGSGLWHMLHVNNASDYGARLLVLKNSVVSLLPISPELVTNGPVTRCLSNRSPHLFWLGMPTLINGMLNMEAKRERMNDAMWHAYDKVLGDCKLLHQRGGPLMLLDIQSLTRNCGPRCTFDGMHYDGAVYDALAHIMLNDLLAQSYQSL